MKTLEHVDNFICKFCMGIAIEHVWFDTSELICIELKKIGLNKVEFNQVQTNAKKLWSLHDPEIVISHCNCSLWAVSFHVICVAHSITSDDLDCPQSDQVFFLGLHNHSSSSQADHSFLDVFLTLEPGQSIQF